MNSLSIWRIMRQMGAARPVTVKSRLYISLAITLVIATVANAQGFKQRTLHPVFDDPAQNKRMVSAAKKFAYTEDVSKFEDINYARAYYRVYVPGKITQLKSLPEISGLVRDVRKRLQRATRQNSVSQPLMQTWLFEGMKPIAEGNYMPAARINAILLIASMETSAAKLSAKQPPIPLKSIPDVLIPIYLEAGNPDGVRAAALKGIRRYTRYAGETLSADQKSKMIASMNELLMDETPAYRNALANAYLQRFAVDILVSLQPKQDSNLAKTLVSVSTKNKNDDLIAVFAASRLANVNQDSLSGVGKVETILQNWTQRASRALEAEATRLARLERPLIAKKQPPSPDLQFKLNQSGQSQRPTQSMGQTISNMDMNGEPDESEMPNEMTDQLDQLMGGRNGFRHATQKQPLAVITSRRKLNQILEQLYLGATGSREIGKYGTTPTGLMASVNEADLPPIKKWTEVIEELLSAINDPQLDNQELYRKELSKQSKWLKEMAEKLSPQPVPAKAPAPRRDMGDPFVAQSLPFEAKS